MKVGIIGAGPAGLNFAKRLSADSIIFERNAFVGGTASSFRVKDYTFDYGPHIIFSKNQDILDYMVKLLGNNVSRCVRKNRVSFGGFLVNYPFENGISELPPVLRYELLSTYFSNDYDCGGDSPRNLMQWLYKNFGKEISEKYLIPYNEKVWNLPVDSLSMVWADRIPMPRKEDMLKSACGIANDGYLHQLFYHYPTSGGFGALPVEMARGLDVRLRSCVEKIVKNDRTGFTIRTTDADYSFDRLASSLPLKELIQVCDFHIPNYVIDAINDLIVNPIIILSIGIRGVDSNKYTAIYFPEPDFLVNRISFPATFSACNAPKGCYSIQAEITCKENSATYSMSDSQIVSHVVDGLSARGILRPDDIDLVDVKRKKYAYVVYDVGYEEKISIVRQWFYDQGISLIGRFGYFEYLNVDGIIAQTNRLAESFSLDFDVR